MDREELWDEIKKRRTSLITEIMGKLPQAVWLGIAGLVVLGAWAYYIQNYDIKIFIIMFGVVAYIIGVFLSEKGKTKRLLNDDEVKAYLEMELKERHPNIPVGKIKVFEDHILQKEKTIMPKATGPAVKDKYLQYIFKVSIDTEPKKYFLFMIDPYDANILSILPQKKEPDMNKLSDTRIIQPTFPIQYGFVTKEKEEEEKKIKGKKKDEE